MKDYHEPNPLIGFLKARMQGASVEEAFDVMGQLCDEANGKSADEPEEDLTEEELTEELRASEIDRIVKGVLEAGAIDGLLEGAKSKPASSPAHDETLGAFIASAIRERLDDIIEWAASEDPDADWTGMMLADRPSYIYDLLMEPEHNAETTRRAMIDALKRAREQYS
jgi:hypothetical protein